MVNERIQLTNKERYYILARDNFICQYCGQSAPNVELHVDHLVPVARGGDNSLINLLAACEVCNLSKQAQPLQLDVIKEKQAGIMERTATYEKFLEEHPLENNKKTTSHLIQRPTKLLNQYKNIAEPLKGKSLHPDKRHAIKINVRKGLKVDLSYARLDKGGWVMTDVVGNGARGLTEHVDNEGRVLVPFTVSQFNSLYDSDTFEQVECVEEGGIAVYNLYHESGLHIIMTSDTEGSIAYGFWSPLKELETPIEIEVQGEDIVPTDDEMAFYVE